MNRLCVYLIHENFPKHYPSYQISPPKQRYIKAKLGWIDGTYSSEVRFLDEKCHQKDYFCATFLHSAATDGNLQVYKSINKNALNRKKK